jgi:hypothetical protein
VEETQKKMLAKQVLNTVFPSWQKALGSKKASKELFNESVKGLFVFFRCLQMAEQLKVGKSTTLILPSKAVELVWAAWLTSDPITLEDICESEFGSPHFSRKIYDLAPAFSNDLALQLTFTLNCIVDGRNITSGILPSLFTIDYDYKLPHGEFLD